ncbi:hypothetical protein SEUCBS139899_003863 [Sporothrix eucalyptigena]
MASRLRRRADNLRNWLRDNVTHRADVEDVEGPEPDMPYLPYPPIKLDNQSYEDGATLSPFFGRLPFEIRRRILVYVFGDQTVHMHLRLERIPRRRPRREPPMVTFGMFNTTKPHGGVTADLDHMGLWSDFLLASSDAARGGPRGWRWQWWGCVCHRSMPTRRIGEIHGLWDDKCLLGEAEYCDMYGRIYPDRCMIGCMGWLLASRQAYTEGIDVLYGTNTICIMSDRFFDALLRSASITSPDIGPVPQPTLLPLSHLAHITRLELAWEWALFENPALTQQQTAQRAAFQDSLARLPRTFPNLVAFYVSFSRKLYQRTSIRADACLDEIHEVLLAPLEAMMGHFNRLQRRLCFVELPINTSLALIERVGCYIDPTLILLALKPPYNELRCWWDPQPPQDGQDTDNVEETRDAEDTQGKQKTGFWVKIGTFFPVVNDEMVRLDRLGQPDRSTRLS